MSADPGSKPNSKVVRWIGYVLSVLPALALLLDGVMKILKPEPVIKATTELGYPESVIVPLGAVLAACVVLYLIPYTAVLGAILLTGYLGGAVASLVRKEEDAHVVFPVIFAAALWLGLVLRDGRLRSVLPWRR